MAVEARHNNLYNLFQPSHQFILSDRDLMKFNQEAVNTGSHNVTQYNNNNHHETLLPIHHNNQSQNIVVGEVTHSSVNHPGSRKRLRDQAFRQEMTAATTAMASSLVDKDIAFHIRQSQSVIDLLVAEHTERVRMEMEKQRKREAVMVIRAFEEGIAKRLKEKDEEIVRMGKLNWVLQERVKTLCVENQLWKDLAHSNEATATSLRANLEQVLLAHVGTAADETEAAAVEEVNEDAESCCGSSDSGRDVVGSSGGGGDRTCRGCGEEEATVLVLPCRHLCLCSSCGSHTRACPVCCSLMTASVRVNFS